MEPENTPAPVQEPIRRKRKYVRKAKVPLYPREVREAMKSAEPKHPPPPSGAVAPEGESEFEGMTPGVRGACPSRCFAARCVITGAPFCAHPHSTGLQGKFMSDSVIVNRYKRAREYLMRMGK